MTHAAFHFTANSEGSSAQGFADVEKAVADVYRVLTGAEHKVAVDKAKKVAVD